MEGGELGEGYNVCGFFIIIRKHTVNIVVMFYLTCLVEIV